MSVPEYFIGKVYAWLAPEDTERPPDPLEEPDPVWELMGPGTNAAPLVPAD